MDLNLHRSSIIYFQAKTKYCQTCNKFNLKIIQSAFLSLKKYVKIIKNLSLVCDENILIMETEGKQLLSNLCEDSTSFLYF